MYSPTTQYRQWHPCIVSSVYVDHRQGASSKQAIWSDVNTGLRPGSSKAAGVSKDRARGKEKADHLFPMSQGSTQKQSWDTTTTLS